MGDAGPALLTAYLCRPIARTQRGVRSASNLLHVLSPEHAPELADSALTAVQQHHPAVFVARGAGIAAEIDEGARHAAVLRRNRSTRAQEDKPRPGTWRRRWR